MQFRENIRLAVMVALVMCMRSFALAQIPSSRYQKKAAISIDLKTIDGLLYAYFSVNNSVPLPFLVDTGSEQTVLSAQSALSLHLNTYSQSLRTIKGSGGQISDLGRWAKNVAIVSGRQIVIHGDLPVLDLSNIQDHTSLPLAGILGFDVLRAHESIIDYPVGKLLIFKKPIQLFRDKATFSTRPCKSIPLLNFPFAVGAESEMKSEIFLVDTGSNASIILTKRYADHLNIEDITSHLQDAKLLGLTGDSKYLQGLKVKISVGGSMLAPVDTMISLSSAGTLFDGEYIGSIGSELLQRYKIVIDCPENEIYLVE